MEKPRYDVFLSHATRDKPVVEELARHLKTRGFEPWLDKWNLIPGEPWQEAIEQALEGCAACAVCLGPSGTGPWQNEEMRAAIARRVSDRSRTFRVIPVLLPHSERGEPSRLPAFLRATTWVEFRDTLDDEKALHRLVCGIRGLPPGADPGEAVAEGACPYRGLQVFDIADALFFFGREALTEWLLDKLRTDRSANRFLAIVGPSGSGKSSLARAGLLAALKQGEIPGSDAWPAAICKPGAQPLESLAVALSGAAGAARLGDSPSAVRDLIRDLGADPRMLHLTTRLALRDAPADRRLVVLVDQFEEVFTLCPDEAQRQALIANLLHAATAADGQTVVVLTLRADFYGRCAAYPDLATAISDRQSLVGPMTRNELCDAVERPAYLAGCELEGGLTDLLLNEVESQPGSLPLLEHALLQIWQRREGGRRLTIAAYREIGGVAGALEKHAEDVYSGFTEEEKEACRLVFLRLVQVDEQGRATKRRLGLKELPSEGVVSRLTDARLLTTDQEKRPTVEVAHEALLANWQRLKQWIGDDREALRTRRRLDEAVAEWIGRDRDASFLLEGGRLAQAEEWAAGHAGEVGQEARDFFAASIAARDRGRRRQRVLTIAACVIAAFAMLAASAALYSRHLAEKEKRIAVAGELSERSRTVFATNPQLGLLLATQALKMAQDAGKPYLPSAQSALHWALSKSGGIPLRSGEVVDMLLTHDRTVLITYGVDRHLRRWDFRNEILPLHSQDLGEMPTDTLPHLAAPPSGQWLLLAGQQGSRLLNLADPTVLPPKAQFLRGEDWPFGSEPFSPDGRWLTTRTGEDFIVRDLGKPDTPVALAFRSKHISTFQFSLNSHTLAVASEDGLIEVRNLPFSASQIHSLKLPSNAQPSHLAFQADGTLIVTAVIQDHPDVFFWAIRPDGNTLGPNLLLGCYRDYALAPDLGDASLLCLSSDVSRSGIWKAVPGVDSVAEAYLPFWRRNIATSSDGRWRAWSDSLGNIYLKMPAGEDPPLAPFTTQSPAVEKLFISSGGRWLITFSPLEVPRFWDLRLGQAVADFEPRILRTSDPFIPFLTPRGEYLRWDPSLGRFRLTTLEGAFLTKGLEGIEGRQIFTGIRADGRRGQSLGQLPAVKRVVINTSLQDGLSSPAISADGHWLAGVTGYPPAATLKLWKIESDGNIGPPLSLGAAHFETLTFSPTGTWLVAGETDGSGLLWDLRDLTRAPLPLTNAGAPLESIAFSPGENVVATSGTRIRIRELGKDGPQQADSPISPPSTLEFPQVLSFSNDGWLAIGVHGDRIQLWNPRSPEASLENRGGELTSLTFSPDGHWLAAGSGNGTIQLWRWSGEKTKPTPIILSGHSNFINSVAFTPDGRLLSYSGDGTIRQWELRTDRLLALGCESAGRTLTEEEMSSYAGPDSYQKDEPCPGLPNNPE